ncbi:hypothetical protein P3342_006507 [Pyrenophora teres f. teres]|nr:hypothetical protein P3342_006507 [Pyrenophora teres f. teres]
MAFTPRGGRGGGDRGGRGGRGGFTPEVVPAVDLAEVAAAATVVVVVVAVAAVAVLLEAGALLVEVPVEVRAVVPKSLSSPIVTLEFSLHAERKISLSPRT